MFRIICSVLLWLGDLNYRIDGMLPEMVKECIKIDHYNPLKECDQVCETCVDVAAGELVIIIFCLVCWPFIFCLEGQ